MIIERRTPTTIADYQRRIAQLEQIVDRLSINPWFNCLTRTALNEVLSTIAVDDLWLCYFDVDLLKKWNDIYGKIIASQNIASSIKPRSDDILGDGKQPVVGQWFSGDEFLALLPPDNVLGYAQRVQKRLARYGMSATFILLPANYRYGVFASIDYAEGAVSLIKAKGHRGIIVEIGR